jgi:8-oxo-dGTP pyrophosphatase MutT (NUDIX family)
MKHKVLIYVLRSGANSPELLVFEHRDFPDAGVQVPAGTVEPGEDLAAAASRELFEESGLGPDRVKLIRKVAEFPEPEFQQQRHVYRFEPTRPLPETWSHTVRGAGEDEGMVFNFYWLPAAPAPTLAGTQAHWLPLALATH